MTGNKGKQRTSQSLAQRWQFQIDQDNRGEQEVWFTANYDRSGWAEVDVPGPWDLYQPALWSYEGVAWYAVTIPAEWVMSGLWQRLVFQRVNYHAKVWLNGVAVGEHLNGYLPFEIAVSPNLRGGVPNTLVMRIDNAPRDEWLPGSRTIEWVQYGGVLQPVTLETTSMVYLSDLAIDARPVGAGAQVRCVVEITNAGAADFRGQLSVRVREHTASITVSCKAFSAATVVVQLPLLQVERWSLNEPILYTAEATLETDGQTIDAFSDRFGLRTIEVRGRQILLNGQPLRVQGVCRYDEYAGFGPTVPEDVLRADLLRIKQAGVNLIRTHYPQAPMMLRLMDEIGLLLMEEVPLNWWGQNWWGPPPDNAVPVIAAAEQALVDMVRRDKNHPCLVIWSMCNECATDTPVGVEAMRRLMRRARQLDATRLITFVVAGDVRKHWALDEADLICTNLYFGLFSDDLAHHIADMPVRVTQPTRENLLLVNDAFGNKPLLVTEFGTHGILRLHGDVRFSEEYQAAYIQAAWNAFMAVPEVAGAVLWCWADYYHRRGFFGAGGPMYQAPFGPYGAVSVDRSAKRALAQLEHMFGIDD
jgi:beta-glucuronidase